MTRKERRLCCRAAVRLILGCGLLAAYCAGMYGMVYLAALWVA